MNEQQKAYLKGLVQTAIQSALLAAVWRLPLWAQLAIVGGGAGLMLWWLA